MVEWRGQSDEPLGRMWNDLNVFFVSTDYVSRHQFGGPKLLSENDRKTGVKRA